MDAYSGTVERVQVPDITEGYPSKGRFIGPAWVDAWEWLTGAGRGWTDGVELARRVAANHEYVAETTIRNLLTSASRAGLLEQDHRSVEGTRGNRVRTVYRIAREVSNGEG
jgi:hypothetical protein